jgi:alpha-glucosidase (family GH31 glycosyl hydrolase)
VHKGVHVCLSRCIPSAFAAPPITDAFLWNLPGYGTFNASGAGIVWHANAAQNADFWLSAAEADSDNVLADLLNKYADAVGHAPEMPAYATGFWQVSPTCED